MDCSQITGPLFLIIYFLDYTISQIINTNQNIQWVPFSQFKPQDHEVAGWQLPDKAIFVARMHDGRGQRVGKFQQEYNSIHILVNGRGKDIGQKGEVLTYPRGAVSWEPMKDSNNPPSNLLLAGFDPTDDEPIYVCRGIDDNGGYRRVSPGTFKFSRAKDGCEINHHAIGTWTKDFEILTLSYYGIATMTATD